MIELKNTFRKLIDERPDNILWSQKLYDVTFDYLNSLSDRKINNEDINNFLSQKVNENNNEKFVTSTYSYYGGRDVNPVMWGLIYENNSEIRNILLKNYLIGFVCIVPAGNNLDRTILCLGTKKEQ